MADFLFVARNSISNADLTVVDSLGVVVNSDGDTATAQLVTYATSTVVFTRTCSKVATGVYRVTMSSVETATAGLYKLSFVYTLGGVPQVYSVDVEIPDATAPVYEALSDGMKNVVASVWMRFEDLFDSDIGGPHLRMYAQAKFGRERVAQLMRVAIERLNTVAQPHQSFDLYAPSEFPYSQWGGLLAHATYIEVIKHLMRSYVEQPSAENVSSARLDRRDYLQRWEQVLQLETADLKAELDIFKMSAMSLSSPAIQVAGGVYGNLWRTTPVTRPRHRPPWNY